MSLNEKAEQAMKTADSIRAITDKIMELGDLVLTTRQLENGEALEYTVEQKQKIIQAFKPLKTQLKALVEALP